MRLFDTVQTRMTDPSIKVCSRDGRYIPADEITVCYEKLKAYFRTHLSDPARPIAIKLPKDYPFMLTVLAAWELGFTYIPMMDDYPEERVQEIREDSEFQILVNSDLIESIFSQPLQTGKALTSASPSNAGYAIFTSGSTGRPKGVSIPRSAVENFLDWTDQYFAHVGPEHRLLQVSQFTFDLSVFDLSLFLTRNCEIHFGKFEKSYFDLALDIEERKINVMLTVPNNLAALLSDQIYKRADLSSLTDVLVAGARFSTGLYQASEAKLGKGVKVYNLYGPTESTVFSHAHTLSFSPDGDMVNSNVTIGTPLPGVGAAIVKDGVVLPPHEIGEVVLSGRQLLTHYIKNPQKTAEVTLELQGERFYRTGDLGFQDERGLYYIVGRMDDTIKSRGFRINLLDIESYIHRLDYVEDCAVVAVPNETTENKTVAFIRLKDPTNTHDVKQDLLSRLPWYQVPEKIIYVRDYPTNANGKICKKTLRNEYQQREENT